jgi:hypothetical protein
MRDFLVTMLPDPGAVIFVVIGGLIFWGLYSMLTDGRVGGIIEDDAQDEFDRREMSPEDDSRRRGF